MKLVFYGLDAFLRSNAGSQIYFSTENPAADPNQFIPLDLDKTPAAAQKGVIPWGEVIVDDGGDYRSKFTSVVPGGRRVGGVWVEERHLALLRRLFSLPLPGPRAGGARLHELMSVRYYAEDPSGDASRVGKRYLGFHARMLDPASKRVRVWHAGSSGDPGGRPPVDLNLLDFDDVSKVDRPTSRHGHTELSPDAPAGTEGALFLNDDFARAQTLESNKKPPIEGI